MSADSIGSVGSVVVVGGGQAAAVAARSLRRRSFEGAITIIGEEPTAPYQRPPLSKEYLASGDENGLFLLTGGWLEDNRVTLRTGTRALKISAADRSVLLEDGTSLHGDAVLVTTGSRSRKLPDAAGERIHHLRSLADAAALREQLRPGVRLLVLGAGFIGAEIASHARRIGVEVVVLERDPEPLRAAVGGLVGAACAGLIRGAGVDLRTSVVVESLRQDGDVVRAVTTAGVVEADLALVGIGSVPNDEVARDSGIEVDPAGGIVVDDRCRTSLEGVYAAGDVASQWDPVGGVRRRIEHFDNANRQATVAVDNILGRDRPYQEVPWFWSDQFGANLQLAGRALPGCEVVVRGDLGGPDWTAFFLDDGIVRGAFAKDRAEDVMVARELIAAGLRVGAERLRDPDSDLMDLMELVYEEQQ